MAGTASMAAGELALVGRLAERGHLREALARAAAGAGQAVLVTGQPGVGKSALLTAVRTDARAAGYLVTAGRGYEAEQGLAYGPMVEAFGPDLSRLGTRRASALVQGLPQLGRLFSGVPGRADPLGDPSLERLRVVDALARLCERVVASTPLLLTLDDLHWADSATLELVHHLLRRLEGDRFLLVAAARPVAAGHPAAAAEPAATGYPAFLVSARRLGLLDEVTLDPLDPDGTEGMLGHLLPGATPSAELVDLVHRRSGGLPLFVAALARSLAAADSLVVLDGQWAPTPGPADAVPLPAALRSALDDQLSRLHPPDRAVLDLLAVHAAPLPYPALLAASGRTDPDLLDALGRLGAAGVVIEEDLAGTVGLSVSHALLAEAATAELSAMARQRLHLALADALESVVPPAVDAVARHLRGAGSLAADRRVVPALLAAADSATRRGDHAGAAEALGAAVTRLRHDEIEPLPPVLARWGEALYRIGHVAEAIGPWRECLATAAADPLRRTGLQWQLATAERDRGDLDAAAAHLAAAAVGARDLPTSDDGALLAGVLADRFALAVRREDLHTAQAAAADLAELATRTGAAPVVLEAQLIRAGLERSRGDLDAAGVAAAEALAAARRTGSPALELRALATVLEVAVEAAASAVIRAHADQALALARRLGAPALELRAIGCRFVAGFHDGDWLGADRDMARALALSRRFDVPRSTTTVLAVRGMLQVLRGDLAAAESTIGEAQRQASDVAGDRHVAGDVELARCRLAIARGDEHKVAELIPTLLAPGGRNVTWRLLAATHGLALLRRFDEIPAVADQLTAGSPAPYQRAIADWATGIGLAGTGDRAAAATPLRVSAEILTSHGIPYWAALARLDLAECIDVTADARAQAEAALDVLDGLGARRDADRARRLLRRLGVHPRPARRPGVAGGPLSARELEVARLFAEGLTTAEVAARLVLSPHTATAHLRRIYERLEVHSRAALTRVLTDQGLLAVD